MTPSPTSSAGSARRRVPSPAVEVLTAAAMAIGRGPIARAIVGLAELTAEDHVVDIGCGPGAAVRTAAPLAATVTGVDPSPAALRIAGLLTSKHLLRSVRYCRGYAEHLPLADATATVAWSISAVHHWHDLTAGLAELHRVVAPGGRVLLAERSTAPGARGHAAHGLTPDQTADLVHQMTSVGFADVTVRSAGVGRGTFAVATGRRA